MERINRDTYRLRSGREIYANRGLVGIADQRHWKTFGSDHDYEISEGYDGHLDVNERTEKFNEFKEWTPDEKVELARFMVDQWEAFAASALTLRDMASVRD